MTITVSVQMLLLQRLVSPRRSLIICLPLTLLPANRFISMDTPDISIQSPRSPSIAPSETGPSITDITSTFRPTSVPPVRPTDTLSRASSERTSPVTSPAAIPPIPQPLPTDTLSPAALTNFANGQVPQANGDWSAALQNMLNSPTTLQKLMQALANQQNHPGRGRRVRCCRSGWYPPW